MKQLVALPLILSLCLVGLTNGPGEVPVIAASPNDAVSLASVDPVPDEQLLTLVGALSPTRCSAIMAGLGVALFVGSLATGGMAILAIGAVFAGNASAYCLAL